MASTPVLEGAEWLVILGPIFLTLLLFFISGIPMLEVCVFLLLILLRYSPFFEWAYDILHKWKQESADKKFGNVAEYRLYKRRTRLYSSFSFVFVFVYFGGKSS